jgi:hypothetical protein
MPAAKINSLEVVDVQGAVLGVLQIYDMPDRP